MVYLIKQANSITRDFTDFEAITSVTAVGFRPIAGDNIERYVETEIYNFMNNELPWQEAYIMDGETVIASMIIYIRKGSVPNKSDICITFVNTNENYRKMGLMEDLFTFVLNIYEKREMVFNPERYEVESRVFEETMQFLDENNIDNGYWTLYSIVESYYAKYGFHGVRNFDYFKQRPEMLVVEDDFALNTNEEYVTLDNYNNLIYDDKYIPYPLTSEDPNERSCNFKTSSIPNLVRRLKMMLQYVNAPLENFGLRITDPIAGETFVVVTQHYGPYEAMVQRFFTSVEDEKVLESHLDRIYAYFSHYLKNNYYKLDGNDKESEAQVFWFAVNDMFTTTPESRKTVQKYFNHKKWTYDDTNTENLAMLREWGGAPVDKNLKWTHNGFWSYN